MLIHMLKHKKKREIDLIMNPFFDLETLKIMKNINRLVRVVFTLLLGCGTMVSGLAQVFDLAQDIPFEINGQIPAYPFAGGMNSPQFSSFDMNDDNIDDIIVFDRVGERVTVYLADPGNDPAYVYAREYESLFPPLNNWALIRDYNLDGIPDIVASDTIATVFGVQFYKGSDNNGTLSFELLDLHQGPENVIYFQAEDFSMRQLEVLTADLPAIGDVDFDGDIDILNFDDGGGFVEFFKNMSVERGFGSDSLIFVRADRCWGKFFESSESDATISISQDPNNCFSGFDGPVVTPRHVGSTLGMIDIDGDERMDLMIGDLANDNVTLVVNTGTKDNAHVTSFDRPFPGESDRPIDLLSFVAGFSIDVNHDNLPDVIAAPNEFLNAENVDVAHYYENTGTPDNSVFRFVESDFLVGNMIDVSQASKPAIVDYNADGLFDIVVGTFGLFNDEDRNEARLFLFENNGTANNPSYFLRDDDWLELQQFGELNSYMTPAFGDLDQDDDLDLIVGVATGRLIYFENNAGVGQPLSFNNPFFDYMNIDVGSHANPALADVDNDGLTDLVIGEENGNNNKQNTGKCSHLNFFKNMGTVGNPMFDRDITAPGNISCFGEVLTSETTANFRGYASPQLLSVDNELVLVVGNRAGRVELYKNIRANMNGAFELVSETWGGVDVGRRAQPALWDLNDDGLYELIVGNLTGGLSIFETNMTLEQVVPTNDLADDIKLQLYPNPARNTITILGDFSPADRIEIFSMEGKQLFTAAIGSDPIYIGDLAAGVYIVKVWKDEKYVVRRVVKHESK